MKQATIREIKITEIKMMFEKQCRANNEDLVYVKSGENSHDVHLYKIIKHIYARIQSTKETRQKISFKRWMYYYGKHPWKGGKASKNSQFKPIQNIRIGLIKEQMLLVEELSLVYNTLLLSFVKSKVCTNM